MKHQKTKIEEPYSPETTPNPPQIIDPSIQNERNENDPPVEPEPTQRKEKQEDKKSKTSPGGSSD